MGSVFLIGSSGTKKKETKKKKEKKKIFLLFLIGKIRHGGIGKEGGYF